MVNLTYTHGSLRASKARLSLRLGARTQRLETVVAAALGFLGGLLVYGHQPLGMSLLGVALGLVIATVWQKGDLGHLEATQADLAKPAVQLDQVLEPRLLARLKPVMTAAELWQACSRQWSGIFILQRLGIPYSVMYDLLGQANPAVDEIWQTAIDRARQRQDREVDSADLIMTVLGLSIAQPVLSHQKITLQDIESVLAWQKRIKRAMAKTQEDRYFGGIGRDWASGFTPLLNQFAINLSQEIENGYYRSVPTVHEPAITQVLNLLQERRPVVLVGNVGSGKTALMYSVAERILLAKNVGGLKYFQVMSLNSGLLIASGAGLENAILRILGEAAAARNTIIFLDEAELFFHEAPGSVDISQILLPVLQRSSVPLVFAMTEHDWQDLAARNPALSGQLQRITVSEPLEEEVMTILQDAAIGIEHTAAAVVQYEAVTEAIRLAGRYLPELAFPGKAITVLESATHYAEQGTITRASVQQAIEATTGAKVTTASTPERQQLLNLESQIHERMINQSQAVKVVADALRRSRAGVGNPRRPVGSFLFLGPTGVGKTELAKALAAIYFGGEEAMLRLDMSEYQQQTDVSRLLTPASGAKSGQTLVSGVRQRPSTLLLLDEIEKAHPDILNLLLQMLDEGQLTDSDGRPVSFKDAIIIATSNAGADDIRERIAAGQPLEEFQDSIVEGLINGHSFRPELINRFDEIVVFRPLTKPELRQVVELMLADVNRTLKPQNIAISLTAEAADWLVEHGYDPRLGARPLRRVVQRSVENIVAAKILDGSASAGSVVALDVSDLQAVGATAPAAQ